MTTWVGALFLAQSLSAQQPTITFFTPVSGSPGMPAPVTVNGTNFAVNNVPVVTAVSFNGTFTTAQVTSATQLQAFVPSGATSGPISVTTSYGTAISRQTFYVGQGPIPVSFTPTSGQPGEEIKIMVVNYSQGVDSVWFNDKISPSIRRGNEVSNQLEVFAVVPFEATTGPITTTLGNAANSTEEDFLVVSPTDLAIGMEADTETPALDRPLTYFLSITNLGPALATDVEVIDLLPENVDYESGSTSPGGTISPSGRIITATFPTLEPEAVATVTLVVTPTALGAIENAAQVTSNEPDPDGTNNAASLILTVEERNADLEIEMVTDPEEVMDGEIFTYVITATNLGPLEATRVMIRDNLPTEVSYFAATSPDGTVTRNGNQVTVEWETVDVDQVVTASILVTPLVSTEISNTATIESDETDPDNSNNSVTVVVTPQSRSADLAVSQAVDPPQPILGGETTFVVTIENLGPNEATDVRAVNTLPGNITFVRSETSQGTSSRSGSLVTAEFGSIPAGSSATLSIIVLPQDTEDMTNSAFAEADEEDPDTGNNQTTLTVAAIDTPPELEIIQTGPSEVTLSWPATASGYQLQITEKLLPINWLNYILPPEEVGNQLQVVHPIPTGSTSSYFRLIRQ